MRKKYKNQIIGINPEFIKLYILKPLTIILVVAAFVSISIQKYNSYANEKAERESIEALQKAELEEEERLKESIRKRQEEIENENKRKRESIEKAEIEKRITNTLYEDTITKKVIDGKKYWRNDTTKKVGKVEKIYGLEVVTNNNWSFELDDNGNLPEDVINIGYREYIQELKKQKIKESATNPMEVYKIEQQYNEARAEERKQVLKKFNNKKYIYIRFEDKKYFVKKIDGRDLILQEQGTGKKIMLDAYDERITEITAKQYYIVGE